MTEEQAFKCYEAVCTFTCHSWKQGAVVFMMCAFVTGRLSEQPQSSESESGAKWTVTLVLCLHSVFIKLEASFFGKNSSG